MTRLAFIATSLLALLLPLIGAGQCQFHRTYDVLGGNNAARSVVATADGNYVVCGLNTQTPSSSLLIAKVNSCGDSLWQTSSNWAASGGEPGNSIVQTTDDNFIICGAVYDSAEAASDSYLYKINPNGDSLWLNIYDYGYNDRFEQVLQTPDSGFVILGWRNETGDSTLFVVKTDQYGNEQWVTYTGSPHFDYPDDITICSDGNYLISGSVTDNMNALQDWFLIKIDTNGSELWSRTYSSGTGDVGANIAEMPNGGFLLTGGRETSSGSGTNEAWIVKTDTAGNQVWDTLWSLPFVHSFLAEVHRLADGNYVASGLVQLPQFGSAGWLVKFTEQGDTLWTRQYPYYEEPGLTIPFDSQPTKDGGFILAGYVIDVAGPLSNDVWLCKVDSLGNVCTITDTVTGCTNLNCSYTAADFPAPDTVFIGDTVELAGNCLAHSWQWSHPYGTDTVADIALMFPDSGSYSVQLITSFDTVCHDTAAVQIAVVWPVSCDTIVADFDLPDTLRVAQGAVVSLVAPPNVPWWVWTLPGGGSSTDSALSLTLPDSGSYTVSLAVAYDTLCADVNTQTVVVVDTLDCDTITATFALADTLYLVDSASVTLNGPANALSWHWTLPAGDTSTASSYTVTFTDTGSYSITLAVGYDTLCSDTLTQSVVVLDTTTGLGEQLRQLHSLRVYPNPAAEKLTVELPETGNTAIIELRDVYGRLCYASPRLPADSRTHTIYVSQFSAGTYILRLIGAATSVNALVVLK